MKKSLVLILLIGAISFMGFSKTTPDLRQNSSHEEFVSVDVENVLAVNVDLAIDYALQNEAVLTVNKSSDFSEVKKSTLSPNVAFLNFADIQHRNCSEIKIINAFEQRSLGNLNFSNRENSKLLKNPRDGLRC